MNYLTHTIAVRSQLTENAKFTLDRSLQLRDQIEQEIKRLTKL